jgi:hypothetical protein
MSLEQIYKRVAAKTKRWMSMTYDHVMDNLKEMSTVDDALEILGYASAEDIEAEIFSITQGAKNN